MRQPKRGLGSLADNAALQSLSGDPSEAAAVASPNSRNARWFFLQQSASQLASEVGIHAVFQEIATMPTGMDPFSKFWPHLIARHRATQLAATIEGNDFLRYASVVPRDVVVPGEWLEWLLADPAMISLVGVPAPTHGDVISAYLRKVTSVKGCNAHVTHRDLNVAILGKDGRLIQDVDQAEAEYPVDEETIASILLWARTSWFRGEEAFTNPAVLDTESGVISTLFLATRSEAKAKAAQLAGLPDRVSQQRGKTLARRGALSQHVFFTQATKVGLDYVRR